MGRAMFSTVAILLLGLLVTTVCAETTGSTENDELANSTANETMTSDATAAEAASEGGDGGGEGGKTTGSGGDGGGGGGSTDGDKDGSDSESGGSSSSGDSGDGSTATGGSGASGSSGGGKGEEGEDGTVTGASGASGGSGNGGSESSNGGNGTETDDNTASSGSTEASGNGGDGSASGSGESSSGGSGGEATSGSGGTNDTTGGGSTGQASGGGSTGDDGSSGGGESTGNETGDSSSSSGGSGSSNGGTGTTDDGESDGSSTSDDTETIATADGLSIPKDLLTGDEMLLIRVTKGVLSSEEIDKFLEKETDEHNNFKNAVPKIIEYLKTDAQTGKLTPNDAKFEGVVRVDDESVRADYSVPCNPSFEDIKFKNDLIDYFNPKDVFNMDGTDISVKKVPVPKKENVFQSTVTMTGEEFKPAYKDQKSTDYIEFKENYETKMLSDLQSKLPEAQVISVVLLELRRGSLIATSIVNTNSSSSAAKIQSGLTEVADDPNAQIKIETPAVISPTYIASGAEAEEVKPIVPPEEEEVDDSDKELTKGTVTGFINPQDIEMKYSDPVGSFMKYFVSVTIPAFCVILFLLLCLLCCTGQSCQALCGKENNKAKSIP